MQHGFIAAYITIVVLVAHVYAQDLHVSITPTSSRFNADQDVKIILKCTNNGPDSVLFYKHYLLEEQLSNQLFEVTCEDMPVQYVGRLVKRKVPTHEDMFELKSGKSVSSTVRLSTEYNMNKTCNYTVIFKHDIGPMLRTSASLLGLNMPIEAGDEFILQSPAVSLFAEGRPNPRIVKQVKFRSARDSPTSSYINCSSSQQSSIAAGLDAAKNYAIGSVQYLATAAPGRPRYVTWFGTYSTSRLNTIKTHYNNINTTFQTKSMSFDCSTCTQANTYAYVYANAPYKIYLCPVFWQAPTTGTDSKGGTIIHETSHFTVVAGTQDYTYGQAGCKSLAKSSPNKAIMNADSHEYFAENNPPQT